jgi:acetoin utilization protein AcuB
MSVFMNVQDVMVKDALSVTPETTMEQALNEMLLNNVRHLPVLDQTGKLVGVITDRDMRLMLDSPLLRLDEELSTRLLHVHYVQEHMQTTLVTISPDDSLKKAIRLMMLEGIGALPVVNQEGLMQGLITTTDLLRVLDSLLDMEEAVVLLEN